MTGKTRRIAARLGALAVLLGAFYLLALQLAFLDHGQEFGAYGQYNRVLRLVRTSDDYVLIDHRVRRKLELAHLLHVEEFSVKIRDRTGRTAEIRFGKNSPDFTTRDAAALRTIIKNRFDQAVTQRP